MKPTIKKKHALELYVYMATRAVCFLTPIANALRFVWHICYIDSPTLCSLSSGHVAFCHVLHFDIKNRHTGTALTKQKQQ